MKVNFEFSLLSQLKGQFSLEHFMKIQTCCLKITPFPQWLNLFSFKVPFARGTYSLNCLAVNGKPKCSRNEIHLQCIKARSMLKTIDI